MKLWDGRGITLLISCLVILVMVNIVYEVMMNEGLHILYRDKRDDDYVHCIVELAVYIVIDIVLYTHCVTF